MEPALTFQSLLYSYHKDMSAPTEMSVDALKNDNSMENISKCSLRSVLREYPKLHAQPYRVCLWIEYPWVVVR